MVAFIKTLIVNYHFPMRQVIYISDSFLVSLKMPVKNVANKDKDSVKTMGIERRKG